MKANVNLFKKGRCSLAIMFVGTLFFACNQDETLDLVSEESENVAVSEAEIDAVFEDVDDLSTLGLLAVSGAEGGKLQENPEDDRFCGTFTFEGDKSAGTITIDFGDGCEDKNGNVRTGKIIIEYQGGRLVPGSKVVITLVDYSINDIAIEGVRTLENISETIEDYPTFHITLTGGKVTWPDETFATREVDRVRVWVNAPNPLNDEHHVTGTANGMTRRGINYDMVVTDTLKYKRSCRLSRRARIPVAGTKVITTDNKVITINYGNGECDRRIEIIVEGNAEEVTVE